MATNQERKRQQRRHILRVAQRLFTQDGFKATHIATIARQAVVSQVTLYKYFDSKLSLGHQVVVAMVNDGYDAFQRIVDDPALSYHQIVQRMIFGAQQLTDDLHPDFYRFIVADLQGQHGTTESMRAYQARKHHFWGTVIQRGRRAGMIAPHLTDDALMMYLDMYVQYLSSPAGQRRLNAAAPGTRFQDLTHQLDHLFFYGFVGVPPKQKAGLEHDD